MKYSPVLQQVSKELEQRLKRYEPVPVKDYGWENLVWTSPYFRWAHLEKFYTEKVSVLHCVVMPLPNSSAPIYGFDVIEMHGRLTGMFLDITPVTESNFKIRVPPICGEDRAIPQWADFFSEDFCCCIPRPDDLDNGVELLKRYMDLLPHTIEYISDYSYAQQKYIEGQRKNPQTYRMLKSHIGEELAQEFIDNVLWPNVINSTAV